MARGKQFYTPGKNMVLDVALGFIVANIILNLVNTVFTDFVSPIIDTIPAEGSLQLLETAWGDATIGWGNIVNVLLYVVTILAVTTAFLKLIQLEFRGKSLVPAAIAKEPAAKKTAKKTTKK